jgi:hypothetical protein
VLVFAYLAAFHITETEYFNGEEGVVIPKHVLAEHAYDGEGKAQDIEGAMPAVDEKTAPAEKVQPSA